MPVTLSRTPSTFALCTGMKRAPVTGRSDKPLELPRENSLLIHIFMKELPSCQMLSS
jgi:hypothetical protein